MTDVGFIILRYVINELTNKYWIKCVNSIRQHYPENNILIIDDNSNYDFITDEKLYKTTVINSEFHKRGELLPYYYYLHNKLFDVAVIIHDSVFINKYIDMSVNKYKFLWEFEHYWDQIEDETRMIDVFNDLELKEFYANKNLWKGCFGGMSIILDCILNRYNRCSFERVIACLLQKNYQVKESLLGNIHLYGHPYGNAHGISFDQYDDYKYLPMMKCWTGR